MVFLSEGGWASLVSREEQRVRSSFSEAHPGCPGATWLRRCRRPIRQLPQHAACQEGLQRVQIPQRMGQPWACQGCCPPLPHPQKQAESTTLGDHCNLSCHMGILAPLPSCATSDTSLFRELLSWINEWKRMCGSWVSEIS